jgi:hypothetical protein
LINWKPGFSGKMFWTLEIPFTTGFTVFKIKRKKLFSLLGARILTKAEDGGNCIQKKSSLNLS